MRLPLSPKSVTKSFILAQGSYFCVESEQLLTPSSSAAGTASIREVFGATEEDADKLRIVSLYEVRSLASAYAYVRLSGMQTTVHEEG